MSPNTATTAARGAVATVAVACSRSLSRCELGGASRVLGVKEKDEEGGREGGNRRGVGLGAEKGTALLCYFFMYYFFLFPLFCYNSYYFNPI